jgi:hypothetical protein
MLASGTAGIYFWQKKQPQTPTTDDTATKTATAPMVENLPISTETKTSVTSKAETATETSATQETHPTRETAPPPTEDVPVVKKKYRTSDRRSTSSTQQGAETGVGKRPNPFEAKPAVKLDKEPRPNPF